jgi:hypothetical protein
MKNCLLCKIEKPLIEFGLNKRKKDGYDSYCRVCKKEQSKKYYQLNIEKEQERSRDRYKKNPQKELERLKKYKETTKLATKKWEENNKEHRKMYLNNYSKTRKQKDPLFKLMGNLRIRTNIFLKSNNLSKNSSMNKIIGITPIKLKVYLENQFTEGMSWDNYGDWHIDHIVPLSSSNTIEEINKLCHYTNLQPLWADENIKKGGIKMNTSIKRYLII